MKTRFLSTVAIAALLFASCSNDDTPEVNDGRVKFTSGITTTPQTRVATDNAGNSTWNIDDPIGIYMVANGTTTIAESAGNIPYKATTAAASTSFAPSGATTIYYPVNTPAKVDFIAYHPYKSSVTNWVYPVDVSTQTSQTGIDLMYAATATTSPTGYDKTTTNVDFTFDHQLVKLIFNVSTGAGVTGTVSAVSITGMNTSARFDLTGVAGLTDLGTPQAITPYAATAGTKFEAILLPAAALSTANTVTFTIGNETYTWAMSNEIASLIAGSIYVYNITLTKYAVNATGSINKWTAGTPGTGIAD